MFDTLIARSQLALLNLKQAQWRDRVDVFAVSPDGKVYGGLSKHDNTFVVPGGGLDGDDYLDAAIKEFKEEAGYGLRNPRMLDLPPHENPWSDEIRKSKPPDRQHFQGSRTNYVMGDFLPEQINQNLDKWEAEQRGLYSIDEALKLHDMPTTPVYPEVWKRRRDALLHIKELLSRQEKSANIGRVVNPLLSFGRSALSGAGRLVRGIPGAVRGAARRIPGAARAIAGTPNPNTPRLTPTQYFRELAYPPGRPIGPWIGPAAGSVIGAGTGYAAAPDDYKLQGALGGAMVGAGAGYGLRRPAALFANHGLPRLTGPVLGSLTGAAGGYAAAPDDYKLHGLVAGGAMGGLLGNRFHRPAHAAVNMLTTPFLDPLVRRTAPRLSPALRMGTRLATMSTLPAAAAAIYNLPNEMAQNTAHSMGLQQVWDNDENGRSYVRSDAPGEFANSITSRTPEFLYSMAFDRDPMARAHRDYVFNQMFVPTAQEIANNQTRHVNQLPPERSIPSQVAYWGNAMSLAGLARNAALHGISSTAPDNPIDYDQAITNTVSNAIPDVVANPQAAMNAPLTQMYLDALAGTPTAGSHLTRPLRPYLIDAALQLPRIGPTTENNLLNVARQIAAMRQPVRSLRDVLTPPTNIQQTPVRLNPLDFAIETVPNVTQNAIRDVAQGRLQSLLQSQSR